MFRLLAFGPSMKELSWNNTSLCPAASSWHLGVLDCARARTVGWSEPPWNSQRLFFLDQSSTAVAELVTMSVTREEQCHESDTAWWRRGSAN